MEAAKKSAFMAGAQAAGEMQEEVDDDNFHPTGARYTAVRRCHKEAGEALRRYTDALIAWSETTNESL